ncbi:MAG: hypothetical protein ACYTBJ_16755 [Planctomycetota bacterium]|jgi:hypothetical protein
MRPWLETFAVVILALVSTLLGLRVSKLRKSHCILASAIPLSLIILVACVRRFSSLRFMGIVVERNEQKQP